MLHSVSPVCKCRLEAEIFTAEERDELRKTHYIHEQGKVCNINPEYIRLIAPGFDAKRLEIRAELEKRFGSATIILISHRITTLSKADQVLVMDRGSVAQLGTPEELSAQPGLYQQIEQIQTLDRKEVTPA